MCSYKIVCRYLGIQRFSISCIRFLKQPKMHSPSLCSLPWPETTEDKTTTKKKIKIKINVSFFLKCAYINGSPQNTFVPGVVELATQKDVMIAGDDFKSGQTKIKSVLVDFLVSAGIKVS